MLVATDPIMGTTAIGNKRQLANSWNVKRELAFADWSAKAAGIPKGITNPLLFCDKEFPYRHLGQ